MRIRDTNRILFGFLIVAVLSVPSKAMTLSTILTAIRQNIRDTSTDTTLQRYSDANLTNFVNEAQREFVNMTWCVEKSTTVSLSAGTTYYSLSNDFLATKYVTFKMSSGGVKIKLLAFSEKKVWDVEPDYERSSVGPPDHYYVRYPGTAGTNSQIAFIPIPNSTSVGTAVVWYYYMPADLASGTDVPFDGFKKLYGYHFALVSHVSARIKMLEGKTDEATYYRSEFDRYMAIAADKILKQPDYNPSLAGSPR